MFSYDERTHLNWFRPSKLEMDTEFELVGILIGEGGGGLSMQQPTCVLTCYNLHLLTFCSLHLLACYSLHLLACYSRAMLNS